MTKANPQKITADLVRRANAMIGECPPKKFEILRLRKEAEKLRSVAAADYDMVLGMCEALDGNLSKMQERFEAALNKSGGGLDVVTNFAMSHRVWGNNQAAYELMRAHSNQYSADLLFVKTFILILISAARFHEASQLLESVKKLGASAERMATRFAGVSRVRAVLNSFSDDECASVADEFGKYLRKMKIPIVHGQAEIVDEGDEPDDETATVALQYVCEVSPERAAELNFAGFELLARKEIPVEESGMLAVSIQCFDGTENADQAA